MQGHITNEQNQYEVYEEQSRTGRAPTLHHDYDETDVVIETHQAGDTANTTERVMIYNETGVVINSNDHEASEGRQ